MGRLVERGHRTDLAVVCAMLRRPRRLRDDAKDGHAADVVFNVHVPMRKRLMFFAKIDADDVAVRLSASVVKAFQDSKIEIPDTIRKAYDDFQNPTFQPDRRRLSSVEDFFRYTEEEGRRFFDEMDRDHDGKLKLDDLKVAMRRRKMPEWYAKAFYEKAK